MKSFCGSLFALLSLFVGVPNDCPATTPLSWRFEYDDADRLIRKADPSGRSTLFSYSGDENGLNLHLTKTPPEGPPVVWQFDKRNRLVRMSDEMGAVDYGYDAYGRIDRVQRQGGPPIDYSYDTLDRIKKIQIDDFYSLHYTYDFLGRIDSLKTPVGRISYEYLTGRGILVRRLPNGVETHKHYDVNGELQKITHVGPERRIIAEYTYRYRPDGLIDSMRERSSVGDFVRQYTYDTVGRLVKATGVDDEVYRYEYDALGNRTGKTQPGKDPQTYKYDWAGRLTSIDGSACTHDAAGNLSLLPSGGQNNRLAFNPEGQIESVAGGRTTYRYDGDGRLVRREAGDAVTTFIPDPFSPVWQPLVMERGQGKRTVVIWEGTTPSIIIRDGKPEYLLHDHLGSVRLVADARGNITQRLDYSPFGIPARETGGDDLQPGFSGLFFDRQASIFLTRSRAYDPYTGRFLQMDPQHRVPTGSQKDFSCYAYCGGDPVNFLDVTGNVPMRINGGNGRPLSDNTTLLPSMSFPREATSAMQGLVNDAAVPIASEDLQDFMKTINPWLPDNWQKALAPILPDLSTRLKAGYADWNFINDSIDLVKIQNFDDIVQWPFHAVSFFSKPTAAAPYLGPLGTAASLWGGVYKDARAVLNQWRTERLVTLPSGVPRQVGATKTGRIDRGSGQFSMSGDAGFHAYGEWSRSDNLRRTVTARRAEWGFDDVFLHTGAQISGDFYSRETRTIMGGNYRRTSVTGSQCRTRYNGAAISKAVEEYNKTGVYDPAKWVDKYDPPKRDPVVTADTAAPGNVPGNPPPPPPAVLAPSNVGGIYLRGAGDSLKYLGKLTGIAVEDDNNRLVLLSEGEGEIGLPPLRMDDIVTVFRSVYEHGEAPFVSIDPNPEDPQGPFMFVRHGSETPATYAGWILFEADRLMKAYSLGYDNVTRKPLQSGIAGYRNLIDRGFSNITEKTQAPVWERFWIVPAQVNRHQTGDERLTVFDVPLKINTQRMVLRKGKLAPAPGKEPSRSAKKFSEWFTEYYDRIATEATSDPPDGAGGPVRVFSELRRIALITAIAERLREQGVPMPSWMHDYPVKPCAVPLRTPSIVVEASETETKQVREGSSVKNIESTRKQRVYGGVNLSPADKDIHDHPGSPAVEKLASEVIQQIASVPTLSPIRFRKNGKEIHAVALPGDNTLQLGANQLTQTDLGVPVQRGTKIGLARKFNSFFEPAGALGTGWTFDFPKLCKQQVPVKRTGDTVKYKIVFKLTSPLNTYSAIFKDRKFVPEANGKILVPERQGIFLGLADANDEKLGIQTRVLILRDGSRWHFDDAGKFVARVNDPLTVIYRRDGAGQIRRVEGWYGDKLRADIRLDYDPHGRVNSAQGSNGVKTQYSYNGSGALERVALVLSRPGSDSEQPQKAGEVLGYGYDNGLVSTITHNGKEVRKFVYGETGQLLTEHLADGTKRVYTVTQHPGVVRIAASTANGSTSVEYDAAYRPLKKVLNDGTQVQYKYDDDDRMNIEIFTPTGDRYRASCSADRKRAAVYFPEGGKVTVNYDSAGRPVEIGKDGQPFVKQEWYPNGQISATTRETVAINLQYSKDGAGVLSGVLVTPPEAGPRFSKWQSVQYDALGRIGSVTDSTGAEARVKYDETGQPALLEINRNGVLVERDDSGRIARIRNFRKSVTDEKPVNEELERVDYAYDSLGEPLKVTLSCKGYRGEMDFDKGRPVQLVQFDGGKFNIEYQKTDSGGEKIGQITTPNDVALKYRYDADGRITSVACDDTYMLHYGYDSHGRLAELSQMSL